MTSSPRLLLIGLLGAALAASFPAAASAVSRTTDMRALLRCRDAVLHAGVDCRRDESTRLVRCLLPLGDCSMGGAADPSCRIAPWACAGLAQDLAREESQLSGRVAGMCAPIGAKRVSDDLGLGSGCSATTMDDLVACLATRCRAAAASEAVLLEPATCTLMKQAGLAGVLPTQTCAAPTPPPPSGPLFCGGPDAVTCPSGQACDRSDGLCSVAAPAGRCVPLPATCVDDGHPVCGCDGTTYVSDCDRLRAGVVKTRDGACDPAPVACGNNGVMCPAGTFCDYPRGDCGEGQLGACRPQRAEPCNMCMAFLPGPVCGCDFHTYASDCAREAAGVSKIWDGVCGF